MNLSRLHTRFAIFISSLTFAFAASAGPVVTSGGYATTYSVNMTPGTSNGSNIESVFIFETDGTSVNVNRGIDIASRGMTNLTSLSPFLPTRTLIAGIGLGVPGIGDESDHIYMVVNEAFADAIMGSKWSGVFPGNGSGRIRHNQFVELLSDAAAGNGTALGAVRNFVTGDAAAAWFDTSGRFVVTEFTFVGPPVGGSVPEPGTLLLVSAALVGMAGFGRRQARQTTSA